MVNRTLFSAFAAALLLTACHSKGGDADIVIISTSDIHSSVDSVPQLAALVEEYRSQDTATVFLVDAGDRWTGNPFVDLAPRRGYPIIEQMNALGYDAATLGNHEFDNGLDTLQARIDDARFSIVLANIATGSTPLRQPEPYVIKRAGDVKVVFIGLVTNYAGGHPDGDDAIFEGLTFYSPAQTAARYRSLRRKADVVVALSHLGLDRDTTDLVAAMPWADVIVSGHTHETYANVKDGVAIVQGKNKLRAVGITRLKVRGGNVVDKNVQFVPLPADGDAAVAQSIEKYKDNPYLLASVGTLAADADKTALGQMLADVGRQAAKTDWGIYHRGGTRLEGLAKGDVNRAAIYELEPFDSRYIVTTMTLDELKELIISKFNDKVNAKESHRIDLFTSGVDYTVLTDAAGDATDVVFSPESAKEIYTAAVGDYIFTSSTYSYPRREVLGTTDSVTALVSAMFATSSPVTLDNRSRGVVERRD